LRISQSEQERLIFWAGRKAGVPGGRTHLFDYFCMDGTIPRGQLPWC
jgi:glycolate oxidase